MDLVIVSYHLQNKQIQILKIVKLHFNNLHIKINSSCNGSRMFHQSEHPCNQELLMIKCWCYFSENSDFLELIVVTIIIIKGNLKSDGFSAQIIQ